MTEKKRVHFLIPVGCLIAIFALLNLWPEQSLFQYAFVPDNQWAQTEERIESVRREIGDGAQPLTVHAVKDGCPLSTEYGTVQSEVVLYQVGARYNEVYPQSFTAGQGLTYAELSECVRSMVLDDELAFKLFGDRDPIGQTVSLEGEQYTVVGVAAHSRRIGETKPYAAWIPMGSDETLTADVMIVSTVARQGSGAGTLFQSAASGAFGPGTLYDLAKERMRATMILRIIALMIVIRLLAVWCAVLKRLGAGWIETYRVRLKDCYAGRLAPFAALRGLAMLALAAGTLALCWALMNFFIQPVLVFTEWVPDVLVSWSSISNRFWNLCATLAVPVSCMTAEMAELSFYALLLRWGVIFALIGVLMTYCLRPDALIRRKSQFTKK